MSRISFDGSDLVIIRLAFVWGLLRIEKKKKTRKRLNIKSEELEAHHKHMKMKLKSFIKRLDDIEERKKFSEIFQ